MTTLERSARTARRFSPQAAEQRIRELQRASEAELDARFRAGGVPRFADIEGPTRGGWLVRPRPRWWAELFIKVMLDSPWARWTGKAFETTYEDGPLGRGMNLFGNRLFPRRHGFVTYIKHAEFDGRPCMTLEYRFGSVMWGLIDDVRQVDDGVLLGRFEFRFPWEARYNRSLGYFVMLPLER